MLNKSREIKTTLFVETLDKIDSLKGAIANSKNRSAIIQQALEYWLKNSTVATEALASASQNTLDAALNLKNAMTEIADTDTKDQVSSSIDELCEIEEGKVSVCVSATENEPCITQQECECTDDEACSICDTSLSGKSKSTPSNGAEVTEPEKKLDEPIARRSVRGLTIGS